MREWMGVGEKKRGNREDMKKQFLGREKNGILGGCMKEIISKSR